MGALSLPTWVLASASLRKLGKPGFPNFRNLAAGCGLGAFLGRRSGFLARTGAGRLTLCAVPSLFRAALRARPRDSVPNPARGHAPLDPGRGSPSGSAPFSKATRSYRKVYFSAKLPPDIFYGKLYHMFLVFSRLPCKSCRNPGRVSNGVLAYRKVYPPANLPTGDNGG